MERFGGLQTFLLGTSEVFQGVESESWCAVSVFVLAPYSDFACEHGV